MQNNGVATTEAPIKRERIRKDTYAIRKTLGIENEPYFDIVRHLELILQRINPAFYLCPAKDNELPRRFAVTLADGSEIRIRESVYNAAVTGHPWARIILAHELAHLMYHTGSDVVYAKAMPGTKIPPEYQVEFQADMFAAELLMPLHLIRGKTVREVMRLCGVTRKAAETQLRHARTVCKKHAKKLKARCKKKTTKYVT